MRLMNLDGKPQGWFPPTTQALENGLLCYGGQLTSQRLVAAYQRGIFPCPVARLPLLWWSTHPRAVLQPTRARVGRTLAKQLRRHNWLLSSDVCFDRVVQACTQKRAEGTWITPEVSRAYVQLHSEGWAHSTEVWLNGQLVGGLYGLAMGRIFFGESVFSHTANAGKIAVLGCAQLLAKLGYVLIDCQMPSPLLQSMGARSISRAAFERVLARHCLPVIGAWQSGPFNLNQ